MSQPAARTVAGSSHDHRDCVHRALATASSLCRARGARFTALRRRVLELVWRGHRPLGAYEILRALRQGHVSAAPPTVYRALDFLIAQGFVHRIESRNAYVGCADPASRHGAHFLICEDCGNAVEIADPAAVRAVRRGAQRLGFAIDRQTIEAVGHCRDCMTGSP